MQSGSKKHRPAGKFYYTSFSPRALWQRWRLARAYARPVTFADLRRVSYDAARGDENRPDPAAAKLFDAIIREAERSVFDKG